jgi:pimeloyl-ACP methyl ester carboxylesterase
MMRRLTFLCILLLTATAFANPPEPFERFTVHPENSPPASIAGVYLPVDGTAHGTIVFAHGYGQSKERFYGYESLRRRMGWNVAMFDFREHGESSKTLLTISTLGYYEQWDLRAVIDWLDAKGAAKPYVVYGRSMGASTALLEAAKDPRVSGVIASSPFKNAWLATQQITQGRDKWRMAASTIYGLTYRQSLLETDIPKAIAGRDDLRISVICGELDCFPEGDARVILAASQSPDDYKQLVVAPGKYHWDVWSWRGDGSVMGHDALIEKMLSDVSPRTPPAVEMAGSGRVRWWVVVLGVTGFAGVVVHLTRFRRARAL